MSGHPAGKAAGAPCANLTADLRCGLWQRPERPACCGGLQASEEMCGADRDAALSYLAHLERITAPLS
ncbi:YkgJ family cysteine cluster protein [Rhodocyclus gracilis]